MITSGAKAVSFRGGSVACQRALLKMMIFRLSPSGIRQLTRIFNVPITQTYPFFVLYIYNVCVCVIFLRLVPLKVGMSWEKTRRILKPSMLIDSDQVRDSLGFANLRCLESKFQQIFSQCGGCSWCFTMDSWGLISWYQIQILSFSMA